MLSRLEIWVFFLDNPKWGRLKIIISSKIKNNFFHQYLKSWHSVNITCNSWLWWQIDRVRGQSINGYKWWFKSSLIAIAYQFEHMISWSFLQVVVRGIGWSILCSTAQAHPKRLVESLTKQSLEQSFEQIYYSKYRLQQ